MTHIKPTDNLIDTVRFNDEPHLQELIQSTIQQATNPNKGKMENILFSPPENLNEWSLMGSPGIYLDNNYINESDDYKKEWIEKCTQWIAENRHLWAYNYVIFMEGFGIHQCHSKYNDSIWTHAVPYVYVYRP